MDKSYSENTKYRVNEIFYSLQGEGRNTGRAAMFVRFSGCNLKCSFCDTDFTSHVDMTATEIINRMESLMPMTDARPIVVLTGGEPTLQVDSALIDTIHKAGFTTVAMESNGTKEPPSNLDWLTVSPKQNVKVTHCDELKVVYDGKTEPSTHGVKANYYFIQPLDSGDDKDNARIIKACVDYIKKHPQWQLSLQTHKLIDIK